MWLLYAFSGPVCWAVSTHIDKYLVDRYFRHSDTTVLMLFTAFVGILFLPPIAFFDSSVLKPGAGAIAVMTASGILYMGAMLFYLRAIQSEEASIVAGLFQAATLFTFLLGWLFLHETLGWIKGGGCALIVTGALVLTQGRKLSRKKFKLTLVLLMLAATFVLALSSVLFKFFAVRDDFWTTNFTDFTGEALFGHAILLVPRYRRQFAARCCFHPGPVINQWRERADQSGRRLGRALRHVVGAGGGGIGDLSHHHFVCFWLRHSFDPVPAPAGIRRSIAAQFRVPKVWARC